MLLWKKMSWTSKKIMTVQVKNNSYENNKVKQT